MRTFSGANIATDRLIKKFAKKPAAKKVVDMPDEGQPDPDAGSEDVETSPADEGAEEMPGDMKAKKKFPFKKKAFSGPINV